MIATQYAIAKKKWNLIQNRPAVKKCVAPRRPLWKRCEIQGGGQEMAVMVGEWQNF